MTNNPNIAPMRVTVPHRPVDPNFATPTNCVLALDDEFLAITPRNIECAKLFITCLVLSGYAYHLEDDPETIINGETGKPLFRPEQTAHLRERVAEIYAMDWKSTPYDCPLGYMLTRLNEFAEETAKIQYI